MRRVRLGLGLVLLILSLGSGLARGDEPEATAGTPVVTRLELAGPVIPGTADYLIDAVEHAQAQRHAAVLLVLHTPGGLLDSTRDIARTFLAADVPVIVYVSPSGSHAASAGMFITMAAHVAAMAPGTNIGAAHPVTGGGQDVEEQGGQTMAEKVENDTAAFARSVAQQRGRNVEWAEEAVRASVSATADEAVELGVVDLVAASEEALLEAVDGRQVEVRSGEVTLRTAGARLDAFEMTIQQRVLSFLGDPNVVAILGLLGVLGILMEIYNPGLIVPGAIGVLSFVLAAIGYSVLPVNVGAAFLLILAVGLFVAEIYVTSFGLLTVAGVGLLALGASLLIDTSNPDFFVDPSFAVSWGVILPTGFLMAGLALALMFLVLRSRRRRTETGAEGLVGEQGRARSAVDSEGGMVFVHGELWRAVSRQPIPMGAGVVVVGIEGLTLEVVQRSPA